MSKRETERLRVMIANERRDRLALVAPTVAALGHEVIAREIEVDGVGAVTERAKGILMERHSVGEAAAFDMLRAHARTSNRKLVDVAAAVVDGHALLPKRAG
jgi:ANTAR domain